MKTMLHDLDFYILSDSKWIEFIICQIISNSIKYRINKPTIEFQKKIYLEYLKKDSPVLMAG